MMCVGDVYGGVDMNSENPNPDESDTAATEAATSNRLRGWTLDGAEQKAAVDHTEYEKSRDPDTELHLDGEDDSLYNDGLDIGDDSETWASTDGDSPKGIKG
jgi:hypothetical protein